MPLNKQQLDEMAIGGCDIPGCTLEYHSTVYLEARCHPTAGVSVSYSKHSGKIVICCHKCRRLVCEVAVASAADVTKEDARASS